MSRIENRLCQSSNEATMPRSLRPTIRSSSNPQVKQLLRLRQAGTRRKTGQFLIDGEREILLALSRNFTVEAIYLTADHANLLSSTPLDLQQLVSSEVMSRVSYGQLSTSPVAIARNPQLELDLLPLTSTSLILVLDRTEKPGNLGACLRSASACNVDAVVLTDPVCEVFNPNTIRASRGTVFTLPLACATANQLRSHCLRIQLPMLCARIDGAVGLWDCDFSAGGALIFGNEAAGLDPTWDNLDTRSFSIPMNGAADSLNLSISAAVSLYEAVRQRTQPG